MKPVLLLKYGKQKVLISDSRFTTYVFCFRLRCQCTMNDDRMMHEEFSDVRIESCWSSMTNVIPDKKMTEKYCTVGWLSLPMMSFSTLYRNCLTERGCHLPPPKGVRAHFFRIVSFSFFQALLQDDDWTKVLDWTLKTRSTSYRKVRIIVCLILLQPCRMPNNERDDKKMCVIWTKEKAEGATLYILKRN